MSEIPPQDQQPYIVITGSSGLIGTALAERLSQDYQIVGFDRDPPQKPLARLQYFDVDLTRTESVASAIAGAREKFGDHIASVVHLAAYYSFSGEPSPLYDEVTVRGTQRLLDQLRPLQVEQFLFSSTMLVHTPCEPGCRISETSPVAPNWDYPKSKLDTEQLLRAQHGDLPVVMHRIAGVYDDGCHCLPLAQQIRRIYENRVTSHVFPGDLNAGQSFVHLDDAIEAMRLTIARRQVLPSETVLLIGEPQTLSYGYLQERLGALIHGEACKTTTIPKTLAKAGAWIQDNMPGGEDPFIKPWMVDHADDHYELDISLASRLLGWAPVHNLDDTLPHMIDALLADPETWYREHHLDPRDIPSRK